MDTLNDKKDPLANRSDERKKQGKGRDEEAGQDSCRQKAEKGARFLHPEKPCLQRGRTAGPEGELQGLRGEPSPRLMAERMEGDLFRCSVPQPCVPHPYDERLPGRTGDLGPGT